MLILISVLFINTSIVNATVNKKPTINRNELTMVVGDTYNLEVLNYDETVSWKSLNNKIASVSKNGKVTAKKTGQAIIMVSFKNYIYTCRVKVINDSLEVHYIDVGHGDAILIEADGKNTLIDAGRKEYAEKIIDYLKEEKISTIDNFIITHAHDDHYGGAIDIINEFEIIDVYLTASVTNSKNCKKIIKTINDKKLNLIRAKAGLEVDMGYNAKGLIVSPTIEEFDTLNSNSIVLRLDYKKKSFLFTGDATKESENVMMKLGYDVDVDVLKVGHHGSKTSSGNRFLKEVSPEISIISLGETQTTFPSKSVQKTLDKYGGDIYTTRENGNIRIVYTKKGNLKVYKEK